MDRNTLLLSIRRQHAGAIFDGMKKYELRRLRPRVRQGDLVVVYVPQPEAQIVGQFRVRRVLEASPGQLWNRIGSSTGVNRECFDSYFEGALRAFAIGVEAPERYTFAVPLARLREVVPSFRPPQSYHYLRRDRIADRRLLQCL